MSQRAREFIEYWIEEFLHPDAYEDEDDHPDSREDAAQCVRLAIMNGIPKSEIDEEYEDLTAQIASIREQIVDAELNSCVRELALATGKRGKRL